MWSKSQKLGKLERKWQEEEIHRRDMEEIIEEEPAVQDDVQDDLGSARDAEEELSVGEQSVEQLE